MKKSLLSAVAIAALMLASCGEDDPTPGTGTGSESTDQTSSKDIEYTSANAKSWQNYMVQVASLLKNDASSLYEAWSTNYKSGRSFADIFKAHDGMNYSSAKDCLDEVIEGCIDIASEVGSQKIGEPYRLYTAGKTEEGLYAVESWYSWHSRDDYTNNIYSIRNCYYGSLDGTVSSNSISALAAAINPTLDAKVKAAIADAAAAIQAIPQPFRNNINSSESRNAMAVCSELEDVLKNELKPLVRDASGYGDLCEAIVTNYVDAVVLPTYKSLKEKNEALYNSVVAFSRNPSNDAFEAVCDAWLVAREPWEKSEAFLFGPVDELGLDPNMDSWPLDTDQIVQILNSGNYGDLNWNDDDDDDAIEAAQSVRGFHTLEFLIFKDGKARTIK